MLRGVWAAYERQLSARPVQTQMCTSLVLWAAGDYIAQRIEHYEHSVYGSAADKEQQPAGEAAGDSSSSSSGSELQLDRRRMLLTAGFGCGFVGPVGHFWYEGIEKVCRRLVPGGGARFLATKVVLDSAIMGSVYVAAFFAFGSFAIERSGWAGFKQKMQIDFLPTYTAELALWPAVQAVNFTYVPVRHQLLVVNTFSLLDAAFISWCGNQEDWFGKISQRLGL